MHPNPDSEEDKAFTPATGDIIMQQSQGENKGPCGVVLETYQALDGSMLYQVLMNQRLVSLQGPQFLPQYEMDRLRSRPASREDFLADLADAKAAHANRMAELYELVRTFIE